MFNFVVLVKTSGCSKTNFVKIWLTFFQTSFLNSSKQNKFKKISCKLCYLIMCENKDCRSRFHQKTPPLCIVIKDKYVCQVPLILIRSKYQNFCITKFDEIPCKKKSEKKFKKNFKKYMSKCFAKGTMQTTR